uniref:hypothetical protein n=1 Tax=Herbiconiux sp. YIM B11900 TaxID=3404131 RepID=UPI003F864E10
MIEMDAADAGPRRQIDARAAFDADLDYVEDITRRQAALEADKMVAVARLSRRVRGRTLGLDADE